MIKGLLCLPHPFQPPSLALGFLRLVTQQPKLKFPRADNSNSLSEEACREGILIHQGLLAFTPQPSLALSLASRYLSFQTTGSPSEVRTPVPLGIRTCYTHTAPTMLPPTARHFGPAQTGGAPSQVGLDRCVLTLNYPLQDPRGRDQH